MLFAKSPLARGDNTWMLPPDQTGDWSVGTNWSGGRPTSSDDSLINNGGTATITLSGEACNNLTLSDATGSGTINMTGGSLHVGNICYVGPYGTGVFTQSGGTNTIDHSLKLADWSGSNGSYTLNGNGTLSAWFEDVGVQSLGTFTHSGGTNYVQYLDLGLCKGSNGTYYLSDTGQLAAFRESRGGGFSGGTGTFNQSGGTNTVSELFIGCDNAATGTYNLSAGTLSVTGREYVGDTGPGNFIQSGGTHITAGLRLANFIGSGTYSLNGGTLVLHVLDTGGLRPAIFNFGGGTLQANSDFTTYLPMTLTGDGGNAAASRPVGGQDIYHLAAVSNLVCFCVSDRRVLIQPNVCSEFALCPASRQGSAIGTRRDMKGPPPPLQYLLPSGRLIVGLQRTEQCQILSTWKSSSMGLRRYGSGENGIPMCVLTLAERTSGEQNSPR